MKSIGGLGCQEHWRLGCQDHGRFRMSREGLGGKKNENFIHRDWDVRRESSGRVGCKMGEWAV